MSEGDNIEFSIIIPTYNRAHRVKNTILSALNQEFGSYEVIVIDDSSTDNTEELIKGIQNGKLKYYKQGNKERGAARNNGTQVAKGKYVNFVDSDDLLYPHHLSTAFKSVKALNEPEIFYQRFDIKNSAGKVLKRQGKISGEVGRKLIYGNMFSCDGIFIRKDIALRFAFREDRGLSGSEDWELWLRLGSRFTIHCNNEITSSIISHEERSVLNANEGSLVMRKILALKYAFEDEEMKKKYFRFYPKMESYLDLYVSLHLLLSGNKKRALYYLKHAFSLNPMVFFSRRFYAILKHFVF